MDKQIPGPVLLTGVNGQVGGDCLPLLRELGEVTAPTRAELDLSQPEAVRKFVRELRPRWIINPAAYTAVDKAESERELAFALNCETPRVLAEEAARLGAALVHFSSDYVFSGEGTMPFREDDPTGPLGVYGASKLAGEQAITGTGAPHFIFRTSWVYGSRGKNFLLTILRFARERDELRIVADQHGAPTSSRDLARLVRYTITRAEAQAATTGAPLADAVRQISGVYHACGAGETSWFGFAEEFIRLAKQAEPDQRLARLTPIATADYPTPARRPANSRMNCQKLADALSFTFPAWQHSTAEVMQDVLTPTTVA